ncbi:hypothetical protein [Nocardia blacklockiae]|uniref:hypothetical protein n=1 Tax=Nocardia blacklockiae TaxID=480036 RepID=UPI001895C638|nr:hypothetical protein [Nocardia blacklockiae]MBF6175856.1 hypothetical protein [Nocardia blacklockiae]
MHEDGSGDERAGRPPRPRIPKGSGTLIQVGLQLALVLLDASDAATSDLLARLEAAAAECARSAVPIDTVHHAIHESIAGMVEQVGSDPHRTGRGVDTAAVVRVLDVLTSAVSRGYLRELRGDA